MAHSVLLTDDAARDLAELYRYVAGRDGSGRATRVLDRIKEVFNSLAENPHRGVFPPELASLGIREFREIFFKPYRVVYRVVDTNVYVLLVVDGRRDMQALLQHRLLQS